MASEPQTIRQQITDQIRNDLVSGAFPAGTMLRETELANRLGVSRGPVRDAFLQLSHEGFLAYQANRGVTVRHPPDPGDRVFITSIRQKMEVYAVEKGISELTEELLKPVETALGALKAACEEGDSAVVAQCDIAFHEAIMIACGGRDFVAAWRQLCTRMLLTYTRHGDYDEAYLEHAEIYEALRGKKKRATITAIKANIK